MIRSNRTKRMRNTAQKAMYSNLGQDIRIEWYELSGGTLSEGDNVLVGQSKTLNVLDTKAIFTHLDDNQVKQSGLSIIDSDAMYIGLDTNINLKTKPNFEIIQKIDNEYWKGNGTGNEAIWTPDIAPTWIEGQWVGYWLWFADKRFLVVSNTSNTITVDLDGETLPITSTSSELRAIKVWKAINDKPDLGAGARNIIGDSILFQTIICTSTGIVGDVND